MLTFLSWPAKRSHRADIFHSLKCLFFFCLDRRTLEPSCSLFLHFLNSLFILIPPRVHGSVFLDRSSSLITFLSPSPPAGSLLGSTPVNLPLIVLCAEERNQEVVVVQHG